MAWITRHGHWLLAGLLVLLIVGAVLGAVSLTAAIVVAVAAFVVLVGAHLVAGIASEWVWRREESLAERDQRTRRPAGWPAARFAVSADLREPVKLHDTVKSVKRHLRRHGKRGTR